MMNALSASKAAEYAGVTRRAIYKAIAAGKLTPILNEPVLLDPDEVKRYAETVGEKNGWKTQQGQHSQKSAGR